jgi:hypothetical protein
MPGQFPGPDQLPRIHDGIRYTFEYDEQDYTTGTEETEAA